MILPLFFPFFANNPYLCTHITTQNNVITMKNHFLLLATLSAAPLLAANDATVSSPDGKLSVKVQCIHGQPAYSVTYDGIEAICPSLLGLTTNEQDLTRGLQLKDATTSQIDQHYTLERSKTSQVHYEANCLLCTFADATDARQLQVELRVSNNDVALRYLLPKVGETGSVRVTSEQTSYCFPLATTTFLTPQSDAMVGWKRTKPSYEELYSWDAPMSQMSQYGHGYTLPALFHVQHPRPMTKMVTPDPDELWVFLSETGVDSHYCASRLSDVHHNPLTETSVFASADLDTYTVTYPMAEENNGIGTPDAAIQLPGATPWRTITVGRTLKPIAETTAPWDNVEPLYTTEHQYKMGRGTWSWILWQDESINYKDLCQYVDLSKAMGYEYVLVDNWWDTNLPRREELKMKNEKLKVKNEESLYDGEHCIEDLIDYAHSQGIDVWLWYSSSGYWNDIVQGPTSRMSNSIVRKREMRWMREQGVKGIKVDFFGGDKQETMRLYEEILSDADDNGLMVIFHGCTIPRGWERMYPNYVGSEAVLASENIIFGQQFCDMEARFATLHPVCRNAIGCMEFGGSFQNKYMNRSNQPGRGTVRRTTSTFSLATAVLYQNPIQNFALAPNNLEDAPTVSMDFMRSVPTTWDEVRWLDGYPGQYQIMARRHGDTWYIAAINAGGLRIIDIDLSWLPADAELTLYSGGDNPTAQTIKPNKKGIYKVTLPCNDGVVIKTEHCLRS